MRPPDDLRAIARRVSCSAICDAMMRRHAHRAHVTGLVSPAPEGWLLGRAVTMQFLPLRADLLDPAVHDFGALLDAAVAGVDPVGAVLVVSSWGHPDAPIAYPEIHFATAPLRAAARKAGDAGGFNLWAGEAHALAQEKPAAEVVADLTP